MSYNPAGQLTSRGSDNDAYARTESQYGTHSYVPNALNQYAAVDAVAFSYDARGNLTDFGTGPYAYSAENHLTSGPNGLSLTYDPLGRLYQIVGTGSVPTRLSYDGDQLVAEYNTSNQLLRRYVQGASADEPIVWYEGADTSSRRWLHADERGSIVAVSDAAGALIAINRYDESGTPAATNLGRFQFTGQAYIAEAKLYYFKARFYAPALGRFLQSDPLGYAAGMNLYAYASGDPINRFDPSGLADTCTTEQAVMDALSQAKSVLDTVLVNGKSIIDKAEEKAEQDYQRFVNLDFFQNASQDASLIQNHPSSDGQAQSAQSQTKPTQPPKPSPTQCSNGSSPSRANNSHVGSNLVTGAIAGAGITGMAYTIIALLNLEDGGGEVMLALRAAQIARNGLTTVRAAETAQAVSALGDPALAAVSGGAAGAAPGAMIGIAATSAVCGGH